MSQAGGGLLLETVRASGLDQALSAGLARWRKPTAVHDPVKIVLDLAVSLALGGDCLSRLVDTLAADVPRALAAVSADRAAARAQLPDLELRHRRAPALRTGSAARRTPA